MPPFGAPAVIEVLPEYSEGLLRLEKHSHIWVLAWLDQAERDVLQVTPRSVTDPSAEGLHGVFAVRSPVRPNAIGLTAARILGVQGSSIAVDLLDFLDGTPVVDLKPYFVSRDVIFSATNAQIGRPGSREDLEYSLRRQALSFHGESCADLDLAVEIVARFRSDVLGLNEPSQWKIAAPLARPCLIDAIMGMTRVSLGRGSLSFGSDDCVRFEHEGRLYEYNLA